MLSKLKCNECGHEMVDIEFKGMDDRTGIHISCARCDEWIYYGDTKRIAFDGVTISVA